MCCMCFEVQYRVAHKSPHFSAFEKTHVVSLDRIALVTGWSTVCTLLLVTQMTRTVTLMC